MSKRLPSIFSAAAFLTVLGLSPQPGMGQAASEETPPAVGEDSGSAQEKARKYFEALVKRPAAGYLFERFYNTWLDSQTIEELEKFLKEQAGSATATTGHRLILAFFYAKQNEHVKALEQFKSALAKDPGNADAWYQKALAEARTLDFDSALADLAKALETKPNAEMTRHILQLRGKLQARNGKNEEAMKTWAELIALNPNDEELQEDLIELQISEGLNQAALTTAESLVKITKDPYKRVQRQLRIGDIQGRLGNRDKAIAVYSECLDSAGSDSWLEKEILAQIEQTFRRDDALEDLKKHLSELVAKYPQRMQLRGVLAKFLVELGEIDAALKAYQEILALTPGDRNVRESYVTLLAQSRKLEDAVAQLRELIKQHPDDGELLVKLAEIYDEANKPSECQKALEEFLAKSDQSESAYLRVAGLMERFKLVEASLALFEKAVAKFPESAAAQESRVAALHKAGKKPEALAAWRTMATGADKTKLLHVARMAAARDEFALAHDLLAERLKEFDTDSLYLQQYCELAQRLDKQAEALPWAMKLLGLAQGPIELELALNLVSKLAEQAKQEDALITKLTSSPDAKERCLLADLLEKRGDSKQAETVLQQVAAQDPEMATSLLVRLQSTRLDFGAAAETLRKLVEGAGGRKAVHVQRLVELYERAGQIDKSLTWLQEWKKLSPGNTAAWLKEAALQTLLGKPKEALRGLRLAAQQFEGNEEVRARLADAFLNEGKLADAERLYTQLFEEAKDTASKVRWAGALAEVAESSGKLEELVEAFEERRRNNRASVVPLLALAEIHRRSGNYEERRKALMEAARIKRDDLDLLLEVARIEESENDYDRALETLKLAQPLDKTGTQVKHRQIKVLFAAGREQEALNRLVEFAGGDQMDARSVENLASGMMTHQMWHEALEFLQPLLPRYPKDYRLQYLRAVCLVESGQNKQGIAEFLRLLDFTDELVLPPQKASSSAAAKWFQGLEGEIPEESRFLLELMNLNSLVFSYRQNNSAYYSYRHSRHGQPGIALPAKLDELRLFVLNHLGLLAQQMDDDEFQALASELKTRDSLLADGLEYFRSGFTQSPDFLELEKKFHHKEGVLGLVSVWGLYTDELAPEIIKKAFDNFRDKRPVLAIFSVIGKLDSDDPEIEPLLAEAMTMLEKVEKPSSFILEGISRVMERLAANAKETSAKGPLATLRQKLVQWYAAMDRTDPLSETLSGLVLQDRALQADVAAFFRALAAEQERFAKEEAESGGSRQMAFTDVELAAQPFPPDELPGISPTVFSILRGLDDDGGSLLWAEDVDAAAKHLSELKFPALRCLAAAHLNNEAEIEKAVAEMLAAKDAGLAEFLLAATWRAEQGKWDEAITTLKKAEYLPMTRDERRAVDASLAWWGLGKIDDSALPSEQFDTDPTIVAGREAALRLRRGILSAELKLELSGMLEKFGLAQEAERLVANSGVASGGGTSYSSRYGGYGGRSVALSSLSRLDSLMNQGKRDAALEMLAREAKSLAKAWISRYDEYLHEQAEDWLGGVTKHALAADLAEQLLPGADEKNPENLAIAAAVQDILQREEKTTSLYQTALNVDGKNHGLNAAYVRWLLREDKEKALTVLGKFNRETIAVVAPQFKDWSAELETANQKIRLAKILLKYLEGLPQDVLAKQNFDWLAEYGYEFAESVGEGNFSLPSLMLRNPFVDPAVATLQAERRTILDKILRFCLKVPSTSRQAFRLLAGRALTEGKTASDVAPMAQAALEMEFSRPRPASQRRQVSTYTRSADVTQIPMPEIEDILIEHAFLAKKPTYISDEIIPFLKSKGGRHEAAQLEKDARLYFCAETEFPALAEEFVRNAGAAGQAAEAWMRVLSIQRSRKLTHDFGDALLAQARASLTKPNDYYPYHLLEYGLSLTERRGAAALGKFLEQLAEICLGPAEKRLEVIERAVDRRSRNARLRIGMQYLTNALTVLRGQATTVFASMDAQEQLLDQFFRQIPGYESELRVEPQVLLQGAKGAEDAARVMESLRLSPWLGPVEKFRTYQRRNDGENVMLDIVSSINSNGALKRAVQAQLKTINTFGARVFEACLTTSATAEHVLNVVGKHLSAVQKAPELQQREIANLLRYLSKTRRNANADKTLTAEGKAAREWMKDAADGAGGSELDKFLNAKSLITLNLESSDMREFLTRNLMALAVKERPKAMQVFTKAKTLIAQTTRPQHYYNSYANTTTLGQVVAAIAEAATESNDPASACGLLNFVCDAVCDPSAPLVEYTGQTYDLVERALRIVGRGGIDYTTFNLKRFVETVGAHFDPRHASLIAVSAGFIGWHKDLGALGQDSDSARRNREWLAKEATSDKPHAWFAALVQEGTEAFRERDEVYKKAQEAADLALEAAKKANQPHEPPLVMLWKNIADVNQLPPMQRRAYNFALDEKISLTARHTILATTAHNLRLLTEPLLQRSLAALTLESFKSKSVAAREQARVPLGLLSQWTLMWGDQIPPDLKAKCAEIAVTAQRNGHANDAKSVSATLELALVLGDTALVETIRAKHGSQWANRFWLCRLLAAGQLETAKRLLTTGSEALFITSNNVTELQYADERLWGCSPAAMRNLPKLQEMIESPALKFLAESTISSVYDGGHMALSGFLPYEERMVALAKRYPVAEMTNPEIAERVLAQIVTGPEACRTALPPEVLANVAAKQTLAAICDIEDEFVSQRKSAILRAHLANQAARGEFASVKKALEELVDRTTENTYELEEVAEQTAATLADTALHTPNMTVEAQKATREFWLEFAQNEKWDTKLDTDFPRSERIFFTIFLHALHDKLPEFNQAMLFLNKDTREALRTELRQTSLMECLNELPKYAWPEEETAALQTKSALVVKMLEGCELLGVLGEAASGDFRHWDMAARYGWLSKADALAVADKLIKNAPRHGAAALELAEWLFEKKTGPKEEVLALLEQSKGKCPPSNKPIYVALTTAQVQLYLKLNMAKEAQQLLATLTPELVEDNSVTDWYRERLAQLRRDAQALALASDPTANLKAKIAQLNEKPMDQNLWRAIAFAYETIAAETRGPKGEAYYLTALLIESKLTNPDRHAAGLRAAEIAALRQPTLRPLVSSGAEWAYLSGGAEPPADWTKLESSSSKWPKGKSPIGYGDPQPATQIPPGGTQQNRPITAYFRHAFQVNDPTAIPETVLSLRCDDGAVVYLNGTEILRHNMPSGDIESRTQATVRVEDQEEVAYTHRHLTQAPYRKGDNVLSVEVHQCHPNSSDLCLDLSLFGYAKSASALLQETDFAKITESLGEDWATLPQEFKAAMLKK